MHIYENRCQSVSIIGLDIRNQMYEIACLWCSVLLCVYILSFAWCRYMCCYSYWLVLEYFNTLVTLHTNIRVCNTTRETQALAERLPKTVNILKIHFPIIVKTIYAKHRCICLLLRIIKGTHTCASIIIVLMVRPMAKSGMLDVILSESHVVLLKNLQTHSLLVRFLPTIIASMPSRRPSEMQGFLQRPSISWIRVRLPLWMSNLALL